MNIILSNDDNIPVMLFGAVFSASADCASY